MPSILTSFATLDERRVALEQACAGVLPVNNGQPLRTLAAYGPQTLRLIHATMRLADSLAVSSHAEARRVRDIVQCNIPSSTSSICGADVPRCAQRTARQFRDGVVIWAPHLEGSIASAFVIALSELRIPLLLVSKSAPQQSLPVTWFAEDRASEALERASVIVDAAAHGCDAALPLSEWGVPLVADADGGADELLEGVKLFDRRRMTSIFDAVVSALGAGAPEPLPVQPASRVQVREEPAGGPLVSVVIYTFDRPTLLRYALKSVHAQTYSNVETIVAVDGGPRLDALASEFPDVRFIYMERNDIVATANAGFAAATGKYVTFLNDDDVFFPNHVAELCAALERSGASVAHGDVLTAFLRGDDRCWMLHGFESNMSNSADLSGLLVNNRIGATSGMFLRECIPGGVPFERAIPLYRDYELWLRLSTAFDFVHVERITSCYTIRNQGAAQQSVQCSDQALAAYHAIYQHHPVVNRPIIEQRRAQTIQNAERGMVGPATAPAGEISPIAWPPF